MNQEWDDEELAGMEFEEDRSPSKGRLIAEYGRFQGHSIASSNMLNLVEIVEWINHLFPSCF